MKQFFSENGPVFPRLIKKRNFSCFIMPCLIRSNLIRKGSLMYRFIPTLALFASSFMFCDASFAQATAASDPVGFTTTTVLTGKTGALSLPLDNLPDFVGPIDAASGVTASTIKSTGAGWGANAFAPFATNPHVVRLLTGTSKGRQFQIASHTADTLTLTTSVDLTTVIANGDRYEILKVHTLNTLFGAGAPGLSHTDAVTTDSTLVDNIMIRGSAGWAVYYYDDVQGHWLRQAGGNTDRNNTALLSDQGFLLVRRSGTDYALTVTGGVPTTSLKTDLPANKTTSFPNRFPVATTLVGLNLHTLPAWIKDPNGASPNPDADDNVLIRGSAGWVSYFYASDLGHWQRVAGGTTNRDSTAIDIGTSVLVVRRVGTDITLDQPLPY
jgi:uncharacterized protein (TIGR02597 family)